MQVAEEAAPKGDDDKPADAPASYKIVVTAGTEREEYDGLTLKKGRNYIATKVNAASKLIQIEETGASLPEAQRSRQRAPTRCRLPTGAGREAVCRRLRGRRRAPRGAWAASPRSTR